MPIYVPIVMYSLRFVIQEQQGLLNCLHVSIISRSYRSLSSFVALNHPVSEIVICTAWGCLLLSRTTLFYYNVYPIILVFSIEKYVYTEFVLISCCVNELHGHLCPCRNV